ncbi:tRNA pseudouridine synthase B [Alteribacillus persepolensis]|uniref:tRNA pseudouridine synthase B n=1 Tax=Alteribacillus persepolensis TaxID=568899 RepID=A0A1G7YSJ9_9BACI|nr:tRNA pseudouridine(55) synthase TruB [Alteribacillus persepolensis]SDG99335.1 tRNA pseudouridine synthase B [Alteribacillus persepolensis]
MPNGIIPLYKPKGMTSHDCVIQMRRLFETKKVGHTGTLDPDVEGVLPICIGRATKVAEYITNLPKQYEAEITLGYSTTTEDASGEIVDKQTVAPGLSVQTIQQSLTSFFGTVEQTPPMYSAVKVNGKKLYEYAREGITVKRPTRTIQIFDITLLESSIRKQEETLSFRIDITCSKGTYVRTLAVDIGRELGYPAHMSDLERTKSGPFTTDMCYTLEELRRKKQQGQLDATILNIINALAHMEQIEVDQHMARKIMHGAVLPKREHVKSSTYLLLYNGKALAMYADHPKKPGYMKPKTMLVTNGEDDIKV